MEGFDTDDLIAVLRVRCQEHGSQKAWAKHHGVSPAYVNDVLQGRREISDNFAALLGFERRVLFFSADDVAREQRRYSPEVLACHAEFGGDLDDMQRRYDRPIGKRERAA